MKWKLLSHASLFATPWTYAVHGILQARTLEWVAFLFSRGSFQPRDQTQVSRIAGDSLPTEPSGKHWYLSWAISYQESLDAKTITKGKKWTTWWSWAHSPQTCWLPKTDHQPIRGLWLRWSHTLRHPFLSWPLKMLCWNPLRSSGCLGYESYIFLAQSCNKPFSAPNFRFAWLHYASDTWT